MPIHVGAEIRRMEDEEFKARAYEVMSHVFKVQHEFVNNTLTRGDRTSFDVDLRDWHELGVSWKDRMIAALRDWGAGLGIELYEEVALHLCGQPPGAEAKVEIRLAGRSLGLQAVQLAAPRVALRITALPSDGHAEYQAHLCRFLDHADLDSVQWINITRPLVRFKTVEKGK